MMYKVKISALGALRERIPSELEVDVAQHELSAFEFLEENFNIVITSYSIHYTKLYDASKAFVMPMVRVL